MGEEQGRTMTIDKSNEKTSYTTSNTTNNSNYDPNIPSATATPMNMSGAAPGVATRGNATSGGNNRFYCEKCHTPYELPHGCTSWRCANCQTFNSTQSQE